LRGIRLDAAASSFAKLFGQPTNSDKGAKNAKHDDQVDASSGAFGKLAVKRRIRVVGGRDD